MKIISILLNINGILIFTGIIISGILKYHLYSNLSDQIKGMIYHSIPAFLIFIAYFYTGVKSRQLSRSHNVLLRHRLGAFFLISAPWIVFISGLMISNFADSRHGIPSLGIFTVVIPIAIIVYLLIGIILFYLPYKNK